jgi:hypothetical protein
MRRLDIWHYEDLAFAYTTVDLAFAYTTVDLAFAYTTVDVAFAYYVDPSVLVLRRSSVVVLLNI